MSESNRFLTKSRRSIQRSLLRWTGRALLPILTRTKVTGPENFPEHGPLIVVGNHIAAMETVLMVVYAPWQMDLLGPGDIPPPPLMDAIARLYGYIPINRGNLDRKALTQALGILKKGGILGMFPEGGIWETGEKPAKRGVAWLSYHAQAPILPIGFGGLEGAMNATLSLKRPHLTMNIGEVLPAVTIPSGVSRKDALYKAAQRVMQKVNSLIPDQYKAADVNIENESFDLQFFIVNSHGQAVTIPHNLTITNAEALCKMWYRPAILRIFHNDIHLDVGALQYLNTSPTADAIVQAIDLIQEYLRKDNPAFFTYRFGMEQGIAMEFGLSELKTLARWTATKNYTLNLKPTRSYNLSGHSELIVENSPGEAHNW